MAKDTLRFDPGSALSRKAQQRRRYSALSVAQKMQLMDRLRTNAAFLHGLRPMARVVESPAKNKPKGSLEHGSAYP